MVLKTTSKSFSVALFLLVIVLVMYLALFSYVSDLWLIRSLSFSQGTLQQRWKSRRIEQTQQEMSTSATITCDRSHTNYDLCSINGSCNLDPRTGTITLMDPTFGPSATLIEKIRPYPKKEDNWIMQRIDKLVLTSGLTRSCDITHDSPAIVFSAGGYIGSIYHDFFDCLIPLFITANKYFPDRDFILVVTNPKEWWMPKYINVLGEFSKHKTILLDKENVSITHCFTSAIVGLISHESMTVDLNQTTNSKSLVDFHNLLGKAFNTNITTIRTHNKPRLILVSRYGAIGRVMLNEKEIKEMLEDIGFEVITFRPSGTTSLREAYKLIKSSHGMVGVHGAALTHLLFLRPGSVFVQVVPVGLEWVKTCYESPAKAMKLDYIEYPINVGESSLVEKYDRDDLVLKDPIAFRGMDWNVSKMKVYLKEQDVRLDVNRFRKHMNKAYEKANSFMNING
ncbi:unnamed protein product [Arabis nemorensis]|uniref:Glycosyltransferase 61 catalytic domain-containing protein n=1 Tax=Arabis nemorensis TaxID=586526 RepID=A0A565BRI0_9BRAS|nr:unnamed protein product [Arabis nemorensis]